ncbi:MAG: bifunctional homocysteine S-methyltransferase/methylenetetrahydrofolate reductase [Kiritimatiellae bacterium]|nr:bifunctional homocysteine S-methyltransferase/methylenetetrahydrofolate reductase [Kiritimatiellia bacterium]
MSSYSDRLSQRPLVLDGAMGTVIYQQGVFVNACYDELCLSNPGLVAGIHRQYAEAGADLLLTNTFGANRVKLRGYGLGERVAEINRAAVALARGVGGDGLLVAGDVGPCTGFAGVLTDAAAGEVEAAFAEQMAALAAAGADLLFIETFADPRELALAARVARATGLPVHASFTVNERGETAVGVTAATMVAALQADANVDTIGLNCAIGPAGLFEIVEKILPLASKPLLVKPNAGFPRQVGGRMLYMTSPEYFTEYAKRFIQLGVRGFGGCCGTTPEHIRQAARSIRGLSGVKRHAAIHVLSAAEARAVEPVPTARKSRFAAKLARGERVTSVEILPPKSPALTAVLEKVRACHFAGVDAINIPDGPRASARVSPLVMAMLIKRHVGIEPVPHYCCRDRNLLGMQSDILGAAAAGIENLLVITGDPPKTCEGPDVTGVFDIDSIGLTRLIHNLNHGLDFGGNRIDPPTAILIGVGANPCALDPEREIERYRRKIEAGAEYAITQPVFDADALLRFLEKADGASRHIPILAGIWPLASLKNAEFMRNEVPGVVIPDAVMARLERCRTRDEARDAGIELAREMIARVKDSVAGFQVSAPLGNVETALRVLE